MAITKSLVKKINTYDLKKITETEENYLAWQVAENLFNSTAGQAGVLSTTSTNGTSVGTHTRVLVSQTGNNIKKLFIINKGIETTVL